MIKQVDEDPNIAQKFHEGFRRLITANGKRVKPYQNGYANFLVNHSKGALSKDDARVVAEEDYLHLHHQQVRERQLKKSQKKAKAQGGFDPELHNNPLAERNQQRPNRNSGYDPSQHYNPTEEKKRKREQQN